MVKRPTERGAPLHFAGRELELALFQNFLESADPRAGILLVTGMPGVGKSQLLHRFEANSRAAGRSPWSIFAATNRPSPRGADRKSAPEPSMPA